MLNVSLMASLRNLPLIANYGLGSLFYFLVVALFFLVPSALISAELATGWPDRGGIYIWIREGLGERWGVVAVWVQWAHNLPWYPAILSFVATALTYVIDPDLAQNKWYIVSIILGSFWAMTFLNYLGIQTSSWFSSLGVVLGTIIPGLLIISLAISWIALGYPTELSFSLKAFVPDLTEINNIVFLAGMFLAFAGLEVTASYAGSVSNPQKNYPKAIFLAALITLIISMLGSLSIAIVIPTDQINLVSGVVQTFSYFLQSYHLSSFLPIVALLLVIGAVAEVNSWIIGPIKGLYATAADGNLPPLLHKLNKNGIPTRLLLFQAILVSGITLIFLHMPSISASFWILSALAAQSYLVMYVLMFISAIKLRYTHPKIDRAYQVPFKRKGIWLFGLSGIVSSLSAIIIGFIPPAQLDTGDRFFYQSFLFISLAVIVLLPFIIYLFKKGSGQSNTQERIVR